VQQGVDVFHARVHERPHPRDAGVVHQDVEAAECLHGLLHRTFHGDGIGAVGLDRHCAATLVLEFLHQRCRAVRGAFVGDGDVGALVGERAGDAGADPSRAARDECALSSQFVGHPGSPACDGR
jgi:hypothetical protein